MLNNIVAVTESIFKAIYAWLMLSGIGIGIRIEIRIIAVRA